MSLVELEAFAPALAKAGRQWDALFANKYAMRVCLTVKLMRSFDHITVRWQIIHKYRR